MLATAWNQILIRPIFNALIFLYHTLPGHDLGIAIIVLTIIISLLLYYPNLSSLKAQKEMQKLQPKLKAIQEKYKDDKEKQSKKTMELYQKHKVNPLGSCLPLLIQLPIIYALFYVFRKTLDENSFSLLYSFVQKPEALNIFFLNAIDLTKPNIYILPFIAGALQFWQSSMLQRYQPRSKEVKKKKSGSLFDFSALSQQMVYLFPIVTVFISMSLPASVTLYWATRNAFMVGQQYLYFKKDRREGVQIKIKDKNK